jgi:hypothetical protein
MQETGTPGKTSGVCLAKTGQNWERVQSLLAGEKLK